MSINSNIEQLNNLIDLEKIKLEKAQNNLILYSDLLLKMSFEIVYISTKLSELLGKDIDQIENKDAVMKAIQESRILPAHNVLSNYVTICYKYKEKNIDKTISISEENKNEFIKIFNMFENKY